MKEFLEKNEIYFRVFELVFLGLMGMVVSITQWQTSREELKIHKNELLPLIRIDYELVKTESEDYYDTKILKITNEGKQLRDFGHEIKVFYKFELINDYNQKQIYVPISDFYNITSHTNNFDKQLLESFNKGNHNEFYRVYKDCLKLSQDNSFVFVDEFGLFRISYKDINNENHVEYFKDNEMISKDVYDKIIEESEKQFLLRSFKTEEITTDFVLQLMK